MVEHAFAAGGGQIVKAGGRGMLSPLLDHVNDRKLKHEIDTQISQFQNMVDLVDVHNAKELNDVKAKVIKVSKQWALDANQRSNMEHIRDQVEEKFKSTEEDGIPSKHAPNTRAKFEQAKALEQEAQPNWKRGKIVDHKRRPQMSASASCCCFAICCPKG